MTSPHGAEDSPGADEFPGFVYSKADGIATVRLDRPEVGNALSAEMKQSILRIWADVRADPAVRVILITGTGERHFCTGADVAAITATGSTPSGGGRDAIVWSPIQNEIWKPVVCAVNGLVAGGGLHFVADADVVVAAEHAAFMDTHVSVGQVGAVENIGLAHRMPLGTVLRMTLQGRSYRLPAQRAYNLGLVDELCAADELEVTAKAIARAIAANSPTAVERSKRLIWSAIGVPREQALDEAWQVAQAHWSHPDFLEGARAFVEKRDPQWTRESPS
jgi:enoyl-CoA hydratase/carnithine racemase